MTKSNTWRPKKRHMADAGTAYKLCPLASKYPTRDALLRVSVRISVKGCCDGCWSLWFLVQLQIPNCSLSGGGVVGSGVRIVSRSEWAVDLELRAIREKSLGCHWFLSGNSESYSCAERNEGFQLETLKFGTNHLGVFAVFVTMVRSQGVCFLSFNFGRIFLAPPTRPPLHRWLCFVLFTV
jgi:hypothetical protein